MLLAPRLKNHFVLPLRVSIPRAILCQRFHMYQATASSFTRHRPIPMRSSSTVADRSFNTEPFML